jgi:hypothetical protein
VLEIRAEKIRFAELSLLVCAHDNGNSGPDTEKPDSGVDFSGRTVDCRQPRQLLDSVLNEGVRTNP